MNAARFNVATSKCWVVLAISFLYFVPCSLTLNEKPNIPIRIEIAFQINFAFDQLIDQSVRVPDISGYPIAAIARVIVRIAEGKSTFNKVAIEVASVTLI